MYLGEIGDIAAFATLKHYCLLQASVSNLHSWFPPELKANQS